jgi:hypothetical protein
MKSLPEKQVQLAHITDDPDMLNAILRLENIPEVSLQVGQKLIRSKQVSTHERILLENHHLPEYFQQCREADPDGLYDLRTKDVEYCGQKFTGLHQWTISFGSCKKLVEKTKMLHLVCYDAAHWKSIFGGVMYAAVIPSANKNIVPLMFGFAPSEDADTSEYFTKLFQKQFPGKEFIWINDQGSGIASEVKMLTI